MGRGNQSAALRQLSQAGRIAPERHQGIGIDDEGSPGRSRYRGDKRGPSWSPAKAGPNHYRVGPGQQRRRDLRQRVEVGDRGLEIRFGSR